jgi:hypothetical protein
MEAPLVMANYAPLSVTTRTLPCATHAQSNHRFFAGFMVTAQLACGLAMGGCAWRLQRAGFPRWGCLPRCVKRT